MNKDLITFQPAVCVCVRLCLHACYMLCCQVCVYLKSMSKDPQSRPGSSSTGNVQLWCVFIGQISNLLKTRRVDNEPGRKCTIQIQSKESFYYCSQVFGRPSVHTNTYKHRPDRTWWEISSPVRPPEQGSWEDGVGRRRCRPLPAALQRRTQAPHRHHPSGRSGKGN